MRKTLPKRQDKSTYVSIVVVGIMVIELSFIAALLVVLVAAGVGRFLAEYLNQPVILGELIIGVIIGSFMAFSGPEGIIHRPLFHFIEITNAEPLFQIAEIGVLFLLFSIGMDLELERFKNLALPAAEVAVSGVVLPFAVAYLVAIFFNFSPIIAAFIGASSVATSVGISASILQESGRLRSRVGTLIMGSAVADDVMGILIMTVLFSFAKTGTFSIVNISLLIISAVLFFLISLTWVMSAFRKISERFSFGRENLLLIGIIILFSFALVAEKIRIAALTGAFMGGLILGQTRFSKPLSNSISLLGGSFFIPIFFVSMGLRFNIESFLSGGYFAGFLILAGIATKIVGCGLGAKLIGFTNQESWATGLAMVPRAEVALIVASFGLKHGILDSHLVSAVIAMVVVTAFITPPLLWRVLNGFERTVPA